MTVDQLAVITKNQFDRVDERFDTMEKRFDQMDLKLQNILDVVLEIPSKKAFERWTDKVQSMDVRLTAVERKIK